MHVIGRKSSQNSISSASGKYVSRIQLPWLWPWRPEFWTPKAYILDDTATYWLKIAYFSHPSLIWRPRSLGSLWNFALKLTMRKLESRGRYLSSSEDPMIVEGVILTQCQRVTDGVFLKFQFRVGRSPNFGATGGHNRLFPIQDTSLIQQLVATAQAVIRGPGKNGPGKNGPR